ncbi:MAG TPA: CDP-alcohol phosphatidyltransferase family protein [Gemmatimonadaceae bacterium]|nr:CDP-alcohol phosphatidyltransferase family protein [Gemmatimonadaceae bacterium]
MNPTTRGALLLTLVALATMPVYAFVKGRRPVDADVARRPTTILLGTWIRDWLMWLITPIEQALVRGGVSPDALNYIGGVLGLFAGIAYGRSLLAVGGWLILLGGLADILDGRVARARGIASNYGEFLDSMLDRFAEMFAFMGLAVYFRPSRWEMLATVLALGGSMMVSYARAKGEGVGVDCRGGIMQRAERLVLLALASLLDDPLTHTFGWSPGSVLLVAIFAIGVGSVGTAVYRTFYIARELRKKEALGVPQKFGH